MYELPEIKLPTSVRPFFEAAGWFPGRWVRVYTSIPNNHPAYVILHQLKGLTISPPEDSGEDCAASDLVFLETGENAYINQIWGHLLGTHLISVADVHFGHGELFVAADGRCFQRSCVHDAFSFDGATFTEAVERILLGRRARPMIRPDQQSVRLYGVEYTAECTEIYRY